MSPGSRLMLERIANICRALASDSRLLVLHQVHGEGELPASKVAERVQIPRHLASMHFKQLAAAGLVSPRRSGPYVIYRLTPRQVPAPRFDLMPLLRRAFGDPAWCSRGWDATEILHLSPVVTDTVDAEVTRALDVVFDAVTAFSNVRRLQILRLLQRRGVCNAAEIKAELSMSSSAASRHLDKLTRRGYVCGRGRGAWEVSPGDKTPFHGKLGEVVFSERGSDRE